ncbi:MAG TPA: cell division protein ZipA [Arenimonas sp.]|uniref:cell division protein ZipA n=1 Tax=Arenimonas sp. TaxID=1872635 RepID=UPI002C36C1C3|nr:cell division protein ZipA [Arenimonas sp.]HMB56214.1 cell division protein ZipA [Arenimonas sp.]
MLEGFSDTALLRIGIGIAALILFAVIVFSSRRKPAQGTRLSTGKPAEFDRRQEPTLREILESDAGGASGDAPVAQPELDLLEQSLHSEARAPAPSPNHDNPGMQIGARPGNEFDKIVTLYVAARAGHTLTGPDLVVAAEKAGLIYGHMSIFHRMVEKHPEQGPIFSVANLIRPGSFDLRTIKDLKTPGISFFITLPGPLSALDAWDTLLPTAQRMAELLDAVLLDEDRNALGRQRIANIRDELRAYDRAREKLNIKPGR